MTQETVFVAVHVMLQLVKGVRELDEGFVVFKRPPGMFRTHYVHFLTKGESLRAHVVQVAFLEHPRQCIGTFAWGDTRLFHLCLGGIFFLSLHVA